MRRQFEEDLKKIRDNLTAMATLCQESIFLAIEGFLNGDISKRDVIKDYELKINEMEQNIENNCIRFIAQQHPVASDLRQVSSLLKMITDLERIGDQAYDISSLTKETNASYAPNSEDITKMTYLVTSMLEKAIKACVEASLDIAVEVTKLDDEVDDLYIKIKKDIIEKIKNTNVDTDKIVDILIVIKYLKIITF